MFISWKFLSILSWLVILTFQACIAEPPQITDALLNVKTSGKTFRPGASVDITWAFNKKYAKTIKSIEVWLGHSTGMGHAPTQAIKKSINPASGRARIVIPNVKPSTHGNIWFLDLVWNNKGSITELNLIPITIQ
ncbi:hypothetical protein K7432_015514 [Basidiobolus ranarum]|uniref:Uncharacterized protein n=1 Tax=Basidiobolus ranarum TaxID=34480 RepID=A0ABR2WG08_9FUNG